MSGANIIFLCLSVIILAYLVVWLLGESSDSQSDWSFLNSFTINDKSTTFYGEKQKIYQMLLEKSIKAGNKAGMRLFLSSGTCLGYFRDHKFIDYDYDIDLGVMADEYNSQIIDEMKKEGFVLYRTLGRVEDGLELSFQYPGTSIGTYAKVDIFTHHTEKVGGQDMIYWATYKKPLYIEKIKYRVPTFNLKKVLFKGVSVYAPDPTEEYIRKHYGNDWRTPKKPFIDYYYTVSPTSIVKE